MNRDQPDVTNLERNHNRYTVWDDQEVQSQSSRVKKENNVLSFLVLQIKISMNI